MICGNCSSDLKHIIPGAGGMIFSAKSFEAVFHDYVIFIPVSLPKLANFWPSRIVGTSLCCQYMDEEDKWILEEQSPHKSRK